MNPKDTIYGQMQIRTLEQTPIELIIDAFNKAFSDYQVKVKLTEEAFLQKIATENINLQYSAGAFMHGQLVGFILHAFDELDGIRIVYNGGTGVMPAYRGQGISEQLYRFLIPLLKDKGIERCYLEVIDSNAKAIHVYIKTGFQIVRDLLCFKGILYNHKTVELPDIQLRELDEIDFEQLPKFWNGKPTWQNSIAAMRRAHSVYQNLGLYQNDHLIGYGMLNSNSGRISQFGIHPAHRRQGYGRLLFDYMSKLGNSSLSVINVDQSDLATTRFLQRIGMEAFIGQYEMMLEL